MMAVHGEENHPGDQFEERRKDPSLAAAVGIEQLDQAKTGLACSNLDALPYVL
jgi:hypothetical protein